MNRSSTEQMASAFSWQMSGQMPGWPEAMRVMSRNPPAASRSMARCSSDRSSASAMRVAAVRWGTCDTTATSASWRSGASDTTSAPSEATTERIFTSESSSVSSVGVSTHTALRNRSARAPATPSCSLPAMGWPPTKRLSATAATMGAFTLPTSVTSPAPAPSALRASAAAELTGVATNTMSAPSGGPTSSNAPRRRASAATASFSSVPVTRQPRSRRARPMEPPMSPVPTMAARWRASMAAITREGRRADLVRLPGRCGAARFAPARWSDESAPEGTAGFRR